MPARLRSGGRRGGSLIVFVIALFVASCRTSPDAETATAQRIVVRFRQCLAAGNVAEAERLILPTDDPAARERVRNRLKKLSDEMVAGQSDFVLVEARETGDCAVAAIHERLKKGRPSDDLDPFYLVKREGRWRILPALNTFVTPAGIVDETRIPVFRKLEQWFAGRKEAFLRQSRNARIPQVGKALDLLREAGIKVVGVAVGEMTKRQPDLLRRARQDLGVESEEELIARIVQQTMFSAAFEMNDADGQRMIDGDFNDEKNRRLVAVCYRFFREANWPIPDLHQNIIDRVDRNEISGGIELEFAARACNSLLLNAR